MRPPSLLDPVGLDKGVAADRRTLYAVIRCLVIISEASRRVEAATVDRHPHLWRQMVDAGSVDRHGCENISARLVWRTVLDRLPDVIAVRQAALTPL